MRAREAAGLSRAQLAALTKIPERHLLAIEASDFAALPAKTYAIGFSRSYAKAVGLDVNEVVAAVRAEIAENEPESPRRAAPTFEPGDPARVPGTRFAWLAALAALAVVLIGINYAWRSYYQPAGTLPSILAPAAPASGAAPRPSAPAAVTAITTGQVVFTAQAPAVWVKFYDGTGKQLMQKEMALGETWVVPGDIPVVKIWTAHPDALGITIGGKAVAKLSEINRTIKDVPVTAAALLARPAVAAGSAPLANTAVPTPVAT